MVNMVLKIYSLAKAVVEAIWNRLVAWVNKQLFILFILQNDFFCKGNNKDMLRIMKRFAELSWRSQASSESATKRDTERSYKLFSSLAHIYLESSSEVTLNQLMEVLKMEIIEREKYGRKQF